MNQRQAAYDNNYDYLVAVQSWIIDLKSQVSESEFRNNLDYYYNKLQDYKQKDLSSMKWQINDVELAVKKEISNYNYRVEQAKEVQENWEKGQKALKNESYNSAVTYFTKTIRSNPDFSGSYLLRGYAYSMLKQTYSAIDDFSTYIRKEPNDPIGYRYRGWARMSQHEYSKALSDFNKQVLYEPTAEAYYNRGSAKSDLKDYEGAISDYKKAIELAPGYSMAYNNMAWAKYLQEKYQDALIDVNKSIQLDNSNYVAYDTRADIKYKLEDYEGCISDCNLALEYDAYLSNSYYLKGLAYIELGNKEDACFNLLKAVEFGKKEAEGVIIEHCRY
jgi:tetratricopeptide (TPR) repeat protein